MTETIASVTASLVSPLLRPARTISDWWQTLDTVQRGLVMLAIVRLIIAGVFMLNILPLDLRDLENRWYLHHGGDQDVMLSLAESIIDGSPQSSVVGLGQPLIMIPWILLFRPFSVQFRYVNIVAPLVVINGFILGSLSVMVVGGIVRNLIEDRRVTLWAAGSWAALPLIGYFAYFWHFDPVRLRSVTVPKLGWLNGLSDGPATFYMLVAVLLLARLEGGRARPTWRIMALIGVLFGITVTFRIHFATMVGALLVYILVRHRWRALLVVCSAGLVAYIPQAWYNTVVFGLPFTTGYISINDVLYWGGTLHRPLRDIYANMPWHPTHFVELWADFIGRRPWLLVPVVIVLLAAAVVVIALWRRHSWRAVALMVGVPTAYMGPMMLAWPFREDPIRFSMIAIPFLIMICVYAAWLVLDFVASQRIRTTLALEVKETR